MTGNTVSTKWEKTITVLAAIGLVVLCGMITWSLSVRIDQTTLALLFIFVLGMLTLIVYRVPTGIRAWIHDVVVDETARGRGVGEALATEALRLAEAAGAISIELTTRQEREAANRLYRRLGFEQRETNVYVWRPR